MTFELSEQEEKDANEFTDSHYKKHIKKVKRRDAFEPSGINFNYTFCGGSGLGWGVKIHCTYCKKTKDITDVGSW